MAAQLGMEGLVFFLHVDFSRGDAQPQRGCSTPPGCTYPARSSPFMRKKLLIGDLCVSNVYKEMSRILVSYARLSSPRRVKGSTTIPVHLLATIGLVILAREEKV